MPGKRETKKKHKQNKIIKHFKALGFTNRLAIYCIIFLACGLGMGFYLAILSIESNYLGSLVCFTAALTPIGTMISVVIGKTVDKSKAENTGGNGDGIKFAAAQAAGFMENNDYSENSPPI